LAADLLRRAAKALRVSAAEAVIAGPWEYRDRRDDPETYPWQVWAPESRFNAGTGFAPGTAEYIALMHPPVALALAGVLDATAEEYEGVPSTGLADQMYAADLTLARAILREDA
jgi:hypothetical protein